LREAGVAELSSSSGEGVVSFGPFRLLPSQRLLLEDDKPVRLGSRALDKEAASWSRGDRWSEEVALADIPRLEAIVCGSVAVTRDGRRRGKGEGYSDLEFAILPELVTRRCLLPRPCTICRWSPPCPATPLISRSV
jgi:5-formyltetrahydrofolate cyclo-ligase